MNYKNIGFIGSGKMAGAIIKGLIKTGFTNSENLIASQTEADGIEEKSKQLGIEITTDNNLVISKSNVIFLATKPNQVLDVLKNLDEKITYDKLIVSICAGVTIKKLASNLPDGTRIIRVMPNTPALVGEGMSGMVGGENTQKEDLDFIQKLLSTIGKCIIVDNENQLDIVTAISGSGPAFYYKVINEIARAGEKLGMSYENSLLLSIQTAIGSAKMAMNRDITMEQLISNVATKGGCTAVGVDCMNDNDTEKIFYNVIKSTTEKAHALGE